MNLTHMQLHLLIQTMQEKKESIRTDRGSLPSVRALMMADCDVIINAAQEELHGA